MRAISMKDNPYFSAPDETDMREDMNKIFGKTWPPARACWALVIAGISLVPVLWLASAFLDSDQQQWWAPKSLSFLPPLMILDLILNSPEIEILLSSAAFLILFAVLSLPLASGRPRIPRRSVVFVFAVQALNLVYLVVALPNGIRVDAGYATTVSVISLGLCCALVSMAVRCARCPRFLTALGFQWLAWFWLILYSFPVLFTVFTDV